MELWYLILGWALGVLSPIIVQWIQKQNTKKEIQKTLQAELDEFRHKLVCLIFTLSKHKSIWNRESINWISKHFNNYNGIHTNKRVAKGIAKLAKLDDEQLAHINQSNSPHPLRTKSLKKYSIPFTESKLNYLTHFPIKFQSKILDIRAQIMVYNEMVDESREYHFLTFDSSITEENHEIIKFNIDELFDLVIERSTNIVNSIDELNFS